jgi:hypothetical protein
MSDAVRLSCMWFSVPPALSPRRRFFHVACRAG